jgi:hypothetical protein
MTEDKARGKRCACSATTWNVWAECSDEGKGRSSEWLSISTTCLVFCHRQSSWLCHCLSPWFRITFCRPPLTICRQRHPFHPPESSLSSQRTMAGSISPGSCSASWDSDRVTCGSCEGETASWGVWAWNGGKGTRSADGSVLAYGCKVSEDYVSLTYMVKAIRPRA